jgi:hypothetical protein
MQNKLKSKLRIVNSIGEKTEIRLKKRGIISLEDLKWNLKHYATVRHILDLINNKDYMELAEYKCINDLDLSFCFKKSEFLFLDIETLGLHHEPIILVGLGSYRKDNFQIRIFFARELEEEMAILEHLKRNEFPNFRCFITYNGKSFDIPFLINRFLYFFEENPLISSEQDLNSLINTRYHHIDLLHCCRRKYKDQLTEFNLKTVEEKILDFKRVFDLPSHLIGDVYRLYHRDKKKYVGLIKCLIEHNFYDVFSMPLIFTRLLE